MLHVFADGFETSRSDFAKVPVSDIPLDSAADFQPSVWTASLGSSALTPDVAAGLTRDGFHNSMLVLAAVNADFVSRTIGSDHGDLGFLIPQSHPGLTPLPPVGLAPPPTSPPQSDEINFIAGVDASNKIVATSFATWNSDPVATNPATYNATSSTAKWGAGDAGTTGGTVTYFFDAASNWSATEQAVFVASYALWSDLANIQFAPAADSGTANILIKRGAAGSGAFFSGPSSGSGSAGTVGTSNVLHFNSTGGFINLATADSSFGPVTADPGVAGGHVWGTIVHEEGHSIGLGHGGPYNGTVDAATQQFSAQDTTLWTIMSYIDPTTATAKYFASYPVTGTSWGQTEDINNPGSFFGNSPTTAMMLDIVAAQQLYGAPVTTAYNGGQIFGFNTNIADASAPFYNFSINKNPVVTIWDAGTNNTLDLSGFAANSTVNLNPGTFSSANGQVNNIGIAFGTAINTFVGGSGDDTVTANGNGDLFRGQNGGNDTFNGGAGNDGFFLGAAYTIGDKFDGGAGNNDQIALQGDYSGGANITGTQLVNVEVLALLGGSSYTLTLTDNVVNAGTFSVWAIQLTGANFANVNASAETSSNYNFYMGQGNDTVVAGGGNDLIYGEGGKDTLTGGAGNDTFAYLAVSNSTSAAFDVITDFNATADKFKLGLGITGIDLAHVGGALTTAAFDADMAAAINASALLANHAVTFLPSSGDYVGRTFLIVDANGTAGYQAGADYVFDVTGGVLVGLASGNFV